jgi:hypothetical protein
MSAGLTSILIPAGETLRIEPLQLPALQDDPETIVTTWEATGLPNGLSIDSATGAITGVITDPPNQFTVALKRVQTFVLKTGELV